MTGFTLAYAVMRVCGGQPRKNPGAPDKAFDGEAWSDDGRSFKIIVDCGIMKRLEGFDEDGNLFYAFDCNDRKEVYFNEKGNEITKRQAQDLYPNKYKHLQDDLLDEIDDIINQRAIESNRDEKPSVAEEDSEATKVAKEELSAAESEINKTPCGDKFLKVCVPREK